jgi:hypothetical protein
MTIEIVTSITGGKDKLNDNQVKGNATWTAFMDTPQETTLWNIKPAYDKFKDNRRNSRIHKLMIHKYSNADVTIWIDGNTRLLVSPEELVEKYLTGYDMAMFPHGSRDCIYDEAITVAKLGLDDPELIIEQAKHYEDEEYGKHKGLCSGYFIMRRNNEKTKAFNEFWWADYCRYSRRDQLSLMPSLEKAGININVIPAQWEYFDGMGVMGKTVGMYHHAHFEGNHNEKK